MRAAHGTAQLMEDPPGLDHDWMFGVDADDTQDRVVQGGAENGALALDVQAPASVFGIGPREQVILDLGCDVPRDRRLGGVPGEDDTG